MTQCLRKIRAELWRCVTDIVHPSLSWDHRLLSPSLEVAGAFPFTIGKARAALKADLLATTVLHALSPALWSWKKAFLMLFCLQGVSCSPSTRAAEQTHQSSTLILSTETPQLNPVMEPLSWMLGTWLSDPPGDGTFPTMKPFQYLEEVHISHVGQPMLNFS